MSGRADLWARGHDEPVEVNQRALIDKVLARYSGEFTVFRELLQNSDDAQSTAVEIHFETKEYLDRKDKGSKAVDGGESSNLSLEQQQLTGLKTLAVHQWTFKNNGIIFREEDWNRLKKIAEGNPDEEKIGAFGVGFYSLFSETDLPFVISGGQFMSFYWKDNKDQLFVRRGSMPESDEWTSFEMPLRTPHAIPSAFDFTRFLASSIVFMEHLASVSVYLDEKRLVRLSKAVGIPKALGIPSVFKRASTTGIMNVTDINATPISIKAEVVRWVYSVGSEKPKVIPMKSAPTPKPASSAGGFFSTLLSSLSGSATPQRATTPIPEPVKEEKVNQMELSETNVTLSVFTAAVDVKMNAGLEKELERSTKKKPPKTLKYRLIYTGKDEYDASLREDQEQKFATGSVFQGLRADLDGSGLARIFIGHSTSQTTGLGGHMASRFIPTVERENIDLVDRTVSVWNRDLLYVGGFLARTAYEIELESIKTSWQAASTPTSSPSSEVQTWLQGRALHAVKFFTFHQSTPSLEVASLLEAAFFSCAPKTHFLALSTVGVRNITDIRIPDSTFAAFIKQLPVLTDEMVSEGKTMLTSLQSRGMVKDITFQDVLQELRVRPLSELEMIACLKWWCSVTRQGGNLDILPIRRELLDVAILSINTSSSGAGERILPLSAVQTFINPAKMGFSIPAGSPLPDSVLPISVSKEFSPETLLLTFPWRELTLVDWLRHLTNPDIAAANVEWDITLSPVCAERIVKDYLCRAWQSLAKSSKEEIINLLKSKPCVPTSEGMKRPEQSYFSNANVFNDLPIVKFPSGVVIKGKLEVVLQDLGVRKHVDLQIVFSRMVKTGDWTISDLIKYLVDVKSSLTQEELTRLKETYAFHPEDQPQVSPEEKARRYRAGDLYEPSDVFRKMGLPVINWGNKTKWRPSSEEAKFLYMLGLRRCPPLDVLLKLASSTTPAIRQFSLQYFLDNFASRYTAYDPWAFADIAYVPALKDGAEYMATPKEAFTNPEWSKLRFIVVQPAIRDAAITKLKLRENPPSTMLISLLEKSPPMDVPQASQWFAVMAGHISGFSPSELKKLSNMPIVPISAVPASKDHTKTLKCPSQCYFSGGSKAGFHSKLFVFVDFGPAANSFLSACGTRSEPSVDEIMQILLRDPRGFYELAGGRDNFLTELRNVAVNASNISGSTLTRMSRAPVLLGLKRVRRKDTSKGKSSSLDDLDEDDWEFQYDMRRADEIIIADDTNAYQYFGDSIFTAPQEDLLEGFYEKLGSQRLSSLVREEYEKSAEVQSSKVASDVRALILERLPLFLHEHTHSRTRISYSWMNDPKNFVVKTFGKLVVTKSLHYGNVKLSRSQDASAAAHRQSHGSIELWLAGNAQVDMYEVATSLCRLLFDSPKVNDALLFMTILSTDLRALKRRGYNVDRILKQQKAERDAIEKVERAKQRDNLSLIPKEGPVELSQTDLLPSSREPQSLQKVSATPMDRLTQDNSSRDDLSTKTDVNSRYSRRASELGSKFQQSVQKWGRKVVENTTAATATGSGSRPTLPSGNSLTSFGSGIVGREITPQSHIGHNIDMAIKACAQERSDLLHNREHMQMVKEALDEGYCDVSNAVDLLLAGQMGEVKFFVSKDIPEPQSFMASKRDSLARFIYVIKPLAAVFKLPLNSIHTFHDMSGPMIAFNRNGSLFLNLRFYESWHDDKYRVGEVNQALISWYFTLAHEIAHNLVQPHNSEHEFYMSAICQEFIIPFSKLLSQ